MKIELHEIPIQDIVKYSKHLKKCQGYVDKGEDGVYGMEERLNIRPAYQREFIYKDKERNAVIHSIQSGFPLNVMYWVENTAGGYEVLDGQQRLISIGQYVSNGFSIKYPSLGNASFYGLPDDLQDEILNYKLMVYFCKGKTSEIIDWFKIINIAGKKLTNQELRNAIYTGPWLSDAKRYFSRNNCPAYVVSGDTQILKGTAIRQDYLETVINWISKGNIEGYMSDHRYDNSAEPLFEYFEEVLNWVKKLFLDYRKEMKSTQWGLLYNDYSENEYDPIKIKEEVDKLMLDEDVTKKAGIYPYIFTRDEKYLSIRTFSEKDKRETYERQKGKCVHCGKEFDISEMEADHITPWSKGGKTIVENCQMLCLKCNRTKSAK